MPTNVSAKTVAANATSMMVKPREHMSLDVGGNGSRPRRLWRENRKMKLICFENEANRNV
jgi:hypothetical protein